jgi:DNA-binding HxlR family transcriptional regulator
MSENKHECNTARRGVCAAEMQTALHCLEGRWKMMILSHLLAGPALRFSELQRTISGVSQKMLVQQLRDLERDGIVTRTVYPQVPPKVEYALTLVGKELAPVFLALLDWAAIRKNLSGRLDNDAATHVDTDTAGL